MQEIEVKILEIDRKSVEDKLKELGAEKVFEGTICSLGLDFEDRRIDNRQDVFRIRTEDGKPVVTYKKFISKKKTKRLKEIEFTVDNFKNAVALFEHLGLGVTIEIIKHRTSYKLNNTKVEIDKHLETYSFIPEFLEIEAPDNDSVYQTAKLLGFKKEDCKPWGFGRVLKHYSDK